MRLTRQDMLCLEPHCGAYLRIEVGGTHDIRSTSQELEALATRAGWIEGHCPDHRHTPALRKAGRL